MNRINWKPTLRELIFAGTNFRFFRGFLPKPRKFEPAKIFANSKPRKIQENAFKISKLKKTMNPFSKTLLIFLTRCIFHFTNNFTVSEDDWVKLEQKLFWYHFENITKFGPTAKINYCEKFKIVKTAKINYREMRFFRFFFRPRKLVPAKISSLKAYDQVVFTSRWVNAWMRKWQRFKELCAV